MSKKKRLQQELEAETHREKTKQDCPTCGMHFVSAMSREAHMKLYPNHFQPQTGKTEVIKDEAVPPDCVPRPKKLKIKQEEAE